MIQIYELLLVAAAGILVHKMGLMRPAVILTILECVFLYDCTFRLETVSHLGAAGTVLTVLWAALIPVKEWLIGRALRVRIPQSLILLLAGGGGGLATMMQSVTISGVDRSIMLLAVTWWGAALFAFAAIIKPKIDLSAQTSAASRAVCTRIAHSLLFLLAGVYLYHVFNYIAWIGVEDGAVVIPMIGTCFVIFALLRVTEKEIWMGAVLALMSSLAYPPSTVPMSILLTVVLVYRARSARIRAFSLVPSCADTSARGQSATRDRLGWRYPCGRVWWPPHCWCFLPGSCTSPWRSR